jgi:uncharacterized protein
METRIGLLISRSVVVLLLTARLAWPQTTQVREPIIDMHLHAHTLSMYGTPPPTICTNDQEISFPAVNPRESRPLKYEQLKSCRTRQSAPSTDEELRRAMLEVLQRYNIRAVATGSLEQVSKWRAMAPDRIIPAVPFDDYGDGASGVLGAPGYGR